MATELNGREMPISEFQESIVVRVEASFGFADFTCAPNEITAKLSIQPDETRVKGEQRMVADGTRTIRVPFNSWHITSNLPSKDVNEHLRQLLARLGVAKVPFEPTWGEPSFGVLWVGNYLYAGSGPFYERDVIAGIASLGSALYQDIYQVDEPEGASESETTLQRIPKRFFTGS
jgi:hypothetical protein